MDELWIIYVLVFGAALLGVQYVSWSFRARRQQRVVNRRLELSSKIAGAPAVLDALRGERGFANFRNPTLTRLNDLLVQTGLTVDRKVLILYFAALALSFLLILSLAFGVGLSTLVLSLLAAAGGMFLFLRRARKRRIARFSEQFPDALDIIVRGVKVGHPFSIALGMVAKEMPDPIGTEFGMTSDEVTFGLEMKTAIENLARRVGQEDLLFFTVALNVQSQTGGNLAEVLDRLSNIIRRRLMTRLKIKSLTAEGRLSAVFMSLLPFVLFGVINLVTPSYFGAVRDHPAAVPVLIVALVLLGIGNLMIHKMVNFRV